MSCKPKDSYLPMDGFNEITEHDELWRECFNWKRECLVLERDKIKSRIYQNFNLSSAAFKLQKDRSNKKLEIDNGAFMDFHDLINIKINGFEVSVIESWTFIDLPVLKTLDLSNNRIRKLSGRAFFKIPALETLNVSKNQLQMMFKLSALAKLKQLYMSDNQLKYLSRRVFSDTGGLELIDASNNHLEKIESVTFKDLKQLKELRLGKNRLRIIYQNTFQEQGQLRYLDLSENIIMRLSDITFSKLANLQELNLSGNKLIKLDRGLFQSLSRLEVLRLNNNQIEEIDPFALIALTSLKKLDLNFNKLKSISSDHFKTLSNIECLNLSNNELEYLEDGVFASMEKLNKLKLSGNKLQLINDKLFAGLVNLTGIDLSGNNIEYIDEAAFACLKKLQGLDLGENKLRQLYEKLFTELTEILSLNISGNTLDSLEVGLFSTLTKCLKLKVSGNKLRELNSQQFQSMHSLKELDLSYNMLTDLDDSLFSNLKELTKLNLRSNRIPAIREKLFKNLTELVELDLGANLIGSIEQNTFAGFDHLQTIKLEQNLLTNVPPYVFKDLPKIELITFHKNYIETMCTKSLNNLNSKNPICLYFSLNQFLNFDMSWFEHMNPLSYINHSGDSSIYDCVLLYRELVKLISVIESRDEKRKKYWLEKKKKKLSDKVVELNPFTTCPHLIYILLQSNNIETTHRKLKTMRLFDMLIQDKNVTGGFILNLVLLLREDKKGVSAEIYTPEFRIEDESFRILCQEGEDKLLTIFLMIARNEEVDDKYDYLAYLNIALMNNHEKVALAILEHYKKRPFDLYELLRTFFLMKFYDVFLAYGEKYFKSNSTTVFTNFIHDFSLAYSSNLIVSQTLSLDGITNLGVVFKNGWFTFLTETLNVCRQGRNFYFKCIEHNENYSLKDPRDLIGPTFDLKAGKNAIKDAVVNHRRSWLTKEWITEDESVEEFDEAIKHVHMSRHECKRHHILGYIARSDQINLLTHPTTLTLLDLKWRIFPRFYYYLSIFSYLVMVGLLSYKSLEISTTPVNKRANEIATYIIFFLLNYFLVYSLLKGVVVLFERGILALLLEIRILLSLSALAITEVAIFLPDGTVGMRNLKSGMYSVGIYLVCCDLVAHLDKVPLFGPYVEVVILVGKKFLKFFPIYIIMFFGMLNAFRLRSQFDSENPNNPDMITQFNVSLPLGFARLLTFNIGGPSIDNLGLGDDMTISNFINYLIYFMFCFEICIFLFNIFVGIGVDEIAKIINNSHLQNIKAKIYYMLEVEDFLCSILMTLGRVFNKPILRRMFFIYRMIQWVLSLIVCDDYEPEKKKNKFGFGGEGGRFISFMMNYYEQWSAVSSVKYKEDNGPGGFDTQKTEYVKIQENLRALEEKMTLIKNSTQFNQNFDEVMNYIKFIKDREQCSLNMGKAFKRNLSNS